MRCGDGGDERVRLVIPPQGLYKFSGSINKYLLRLVSTKPEFKFKRTMFTLSSTTPVVDLTLMFSLMFIYYCIH